MEPINLNPVIAVVLRTMPVINDALADKNVTVTEAIDIVATAAKETARQMGVQDNVIATTIPEEETPSAG